MSFAGGREQRKYGAASSRDSLVDMINNRELGEAVNYDDRDEFFLKNYLHRLQNLL